MGNCVAGEVAKSQASKNLETIRARQAHFIKWCSAKGIPDPVGPDLGYRIVLAVYVKYVMTGVNYRNKKSVRSATCKGYALDAAKLFILRGFPSPVDFDDETNWTRILVHNLEREEDIAKQRYPLDDKIHAVIMAMSKKAGPNSLVAVVANISNTGRFLGFRSSEYSQSKQDEVDYHEYPSSRLVMKSINGDDIVFYNIHGKNVENHIN